ncbi:hypothetical protein P691DRAFT_167792 [Macrolepiota fuliginosa MF-IS2]|uniref:Uncharacterized protein n=1 Tax=Macrolepiota fuliginosa MF-IS2 TaxID=1400762 RepID=A0A9P5WWA5_9AGAR|nr:hypothetical protein P691DRAFT_167792 [Macrolepiota fuliginosa MF-IS2]
MSLFPAETRDQSITGLYHMGHGSKLIFWCWEINVKSGYCQEMRTVDLAEGGRIYQEERFDLWPSGEEW